MIQYIHRNFQVLLFVGLLVFASERVGAQTTQNFSVSEVTSGRAKSIATGLLALASLVISLQAKTRFDKRKAKIALPLGLGAVALSTIHLISTAGAVFGSGSGKAGAILALLLGAAGIALSIITLLSKRVDSSGRTAE